MARTLNEVITSLRKSVAAMDDSVDTSKGPVYNFSIAPVAPVIVENEETADRLERLLSIDIVQANNSSEDVSAIGTNFRVPRSGGHKERHLQTFYVYNKPNNVIDIPTGCLVGSANGTYVYKVLEGRSFMPEAYANYYNSSTHRYELNLVVEAVDYGEEYNLPVGRVNKILSTGVGVDGTISSTTSLVYGTAEEDDEDYLDKVSKKLEGLNSGTAAGLAYSIDELLGISDVRVFKPGDDLFTRKVKRAALDVYVNGDSTSCEVMTVDVYEDTEVIYLEEAPAVSVEYVKVNADNVDFVFNRDTSADYGNSTRARDSVRIPGGIQAGSSVEIKYYVNADVRSAMDNYVETGLYDEDVLFRYPEKVYLQLEVVLKVNTLNLADAKAQAESAIADYPQYVMGEVLSPSTIEALMRDAVPNVSAVHITRHKIEGQPFEIGTVSLPGNRVISVENATLTII